jgi:rhodanese-related sulfurtransferase
VSISVFGGMGARHWWKNRYRVLPAQVIGFIETGLNPTLIDVRTRAEYETSPLTLPGSIRLDPDAAAQGRVDLALQPAQMIVTYCTSPEERTSAAVAQLLRQRGFRSVRILKGGLGGWTNARLPVEAKSHLPSIGIEIYKNLTLGDIERRRFPAGTAIFHEGDDARGEAYVVHAGTVEIRRRFDGVERRLRTYQEGELLGEMALFRKAPRSAGAVAVTDVELLVVRNERLEWLIRNRPQLTLEVLKNLSNHVVSSDRERAEGAA